MGMEFEVGSLEELCDLMCNNYIPKKKKGARMNHICADIECPFFLTETGKTISCEGVEDGTKNLMRFESSEDKVAYIEEHCCHYPNECKLRKILEEKY